MADIVCPHCKGNGVNYVITTQDGKPTIQPAPCVLCDGRGAIPDPVAADVVPVAAAADAPELWPILVPLGIFFLFFAFLLV